MTDKFDVHRSRRRSERVKGPFDGYRVGLLETPVQIHDLSVGGCFVNATHEQKVGSRLVLRIDLPQEGWVTVKAETLYLKPLGFAVHFVDIDSDTAARLRRSLDVLEASRSGRS